ncbi:hypothetical protein SCOR_09650 [Sulfidibacter corallicola]
MASCLLGPAIKHKPLSKNGHVASTGFDSRGSRPSPRTYPGILPMNT